MGFVFHLTSGRPQENFPLMEDFSGDYLHGDRFKEVADWVIAEDLPLIPDSMLERNGIIFCPAAHLDVLFLALEQSTNRYLLISHNGDRIIDQKMWVRKPACVVCWFAQNVSFSTPGLRPIPIGLERPHVAGGRCNPGVFSAVTKNPRIIRNWLYMNHRNATNRAVRRPIYNALKWKWWVTNRSKADTPFLRYLTEMSQHWFALSPPGNGLDCHRTWEALYLGVIPVVQESPMYDALGSLPILQTRLLKELKVDDLRTSLQRLLRERNVNAMKLLRTDYWLDEIRKAARQLST